MCAVRNAVLGNLGGQLVRQHLRYEATVQLVVRGAGTLRGRATLNVRPCVFSWLNIVTLEHDMLPKAWVA